MSWLKDGENIAANAALCGGLPLVRLKEKKPSLRCAQCGLCFYSSP